MNRLIPLDFFLLRTPRFSTKILTDIKNCTSIGDLHSFLFEFFKRPEVCSTLYFASIDLYNQFIDHLEAENSKKRDKIFLTLYKYMIRMSSRPTPFGQFSGISYGTVGNHTTSLQLGDNVISRIRLDNEFLQKLIEHHTISSAIKENLTFFSNTSIVIQGGHISFIEFVDDKENRSFQWRRLKYNPLLSWVINISKRGAKYAEIIQSIKTLGIAENKIRKFIDELTSIKLLISETELTITCEDNAAHFISVIPQNLLEVIQSEYHDHKLNKIIDVHNNIKENIPKEYKHIFQIDSQKITISNKINETLITQISDEIKELSVLSSNDIPSDLKKFVDKFHLKYGDQEISLMEALDPENGIGYGNTNNLFDDTLSLLENFKKNKTSDYLDEVNSTLFSILDEKVSTKKHRLNSIELTESDLERLPSKNKEKKRDIPLGIYLLGNLLQAEEKEDVKSSFRFNLLSAGGASSLPLMTRFAYLDDKLNQKLHEIAEIEEQLANNVILAEIIFLPNKRAGNVLCRPSLYKYEIPIIGQSTVDDEHTILLDDQYISVKKGRTILRSKRLNKEVLPRLSSAHNFHYGMVIYRFLCDLQKQDNCLDIQWNWGALSTKPFLPRVTYKHLILFRARWCIKKTYCDTTDPLKLTPYINFLKSNYNLPDRVLLVDGDNELLIDLSNPLAAEIFLKELSKKDIILFEYIYDSFKSVVKDEKGDPFNNEIIIPLRGGPLQKNELRSFTSDASVKQKFALGSEWLYFKIYCTERNWDSILTGPIQLLLLNLFQEQYIKKWFFIRYYDPEPHLRVRLLLTEETIQSFSQIIQLINQYFEPFLTKQVDKITYETYDRELERYGASNIEYCETLFYIESDFVLKVLPIIKQENDNNLRWLIAMKAIYVLINSFQLDLEDKFTMAESIREKFMLEFNQFSNLRYSLDLSYRKKTKLIQEFFNKATYPTVNSLLDQYQIEIKNICQMYLRNKDFNDRPTEIIASLIHMLLNRIFPQKQREQEMVIYHFLSKYLLTEIKKFKKKV